MPEKTPEQVSEEIKAISDRISTAQRYEIENDRIDKALKNNGLPQTFGYGGEYAALFLHPVYESMWKGTFYDKWRYFISVTLCGTLSTRGYTQLLKKNVDSKFSVLGYCNYARATEKGPVIHLIDPFGEITLPPFYGVPNYMTTVYAGKMILCKMYSYQNSEPVIEETATLPFTLRERITKDHPQYDTLTE